MHFRGNLHGGTLRPARHQIKEETDDQGKSWPRCFHQRQHNVCGQVAQRCHASAHHRSQQPLMWRDEDECQKFAISLHLHHIRRETGEKGTRGGGYRWQAQYGWSGRVWAIEEIWCIGWQTVRSDQDQPQFDISDERHFSSRRWQAQAHSILRFETDLTFAGFTGWKH